MKKLLKGMWLGTKNLVTRSKMEHNPRLLVRIVYREGSNWHIGELDSYLKLVTEVDEKSIRDVSQVSLDVTELLKVLDQHRDRIERIELKEDGRLKLLHNKERIDLTQKLQADGFRGGGSGSSMRVLVFDVLGRYALFRRSYTTTSSISYDFPPERRCAG